MAAGPPIASLLPLLSKVANMIYRFLLSTVSLTRGQERTRGAGGGRGYMVHVLRALVADALASRPLEDGDFVSTERVPNNLWSHVTQNRVCFLISLIISAPQVVQRLPPQKSPSPFILQNPKSHKNLSL